MLGGMLPMLFLLFAVLASAQQGQDARSLLQQVSDQARNAKSWRAEFVVTLELKGTGVDMRVEAPFKEAVKLPRYARRETTLMGVPAVIVCDGTAAWTYFPTMNRHQKAPMASGTCTSSSLGGWPRLLDGLQSAVITGRDTVLFQGVPT